MYRMLIGGGDLKEGQWIWNEDFTPMTYTNWNKGEPRGGTRENCVALFGQKKYDGKWLDRSCAASLQFLCKKNMVSFLIYCINIMTFTTMHNTEIVN